MAKVPIYNQNQVKVSSTPQEYLQTQNPNIPGKAFGDYSWTDNAARSLDTANKIIQQTEDRMNQAILFEKAAVLDQWELDTLHDPDNGYFSKSGKDAVGKSKELLKNYDDVSKDLLDGANRITDPYARTRFQEYISRKKRGVYESVSRYELAQKKEWQKSIMITGVSKQTELAVASRYNPDKVNSHIANIKNIIATNSDLASDPELLRYQIDAAISDVHVNIINGMLADNSLDTKKYFEEHKNEINALKHDDLLKLINTNDIDNQGRLNADRIMSMGLGYGGAMKEAQKIKDTRVYDETVRRIKTYFSEQEAAEQRTYKQTLESAWDRVDKTMSYDSIPANLNFSDRLAMKNYVEKKLSGGEVQTNLNTYYSLFQTATNNPEAFNQLNLLEFKNHLKDSDFKAFVKMQGKTDFEHTQLKTADQQISAAVKRLNLGKDEGILFSDYAQELVTAFEQQKGKPVNKEEVAQLIGVLGYQADGLPWEQHKTFKKLKSGINKKEEFVNSVMTEALLFEQENKRFPNADEMQNIVMKQERETRQATKIRLQNQINEYKKTLTTINNQAKNKVKMRSPNGEIAEVDPVDVEFYKNKGAIVINE